MATALDGGLKLAIKNSEMLFYGRLKPWGIRLSGPRILGGLLRPGISFNLSELRRKAPRPARMSAAERRKLVNGLIEAATARGETMTREAADELIDEALTGSPAAIKNLIAGGISAKMTWRDPNKKP